MIRSVIIPSLLLTQILREQRKPCKCNRNSIICASWTELWPPGQCRKRNMDLL